MPLEVVDVDDVLDTQKANPKAFQMPFLDFLRFTPEGCITRLISSVETAVLKNHIGAVAGKKKLLHASSCLMDITMRRNQQEIDP